MRRVAARVPRPCLRRPPVAPHRNVFREIVRRYRRNGRVAPEYSRGGVLWYWRPAPSPPLSIECRAQRFFAAISAPAPHYVDERLRIWGHLRYGFQLCLAGENLRPSQSRTALLAALRPFRLLARYAPMYLDWLRLDKVRTRYRTWQQVAASRPPRRASRPLCKTRANAELLVAWFGRRFGFLLQ